jgi:hypothetical protein
MARGTRALLTGVLSQATQPDLRRPRDLCYDAMTGAEMGWSESEEP